MHFSREKCGNYSLGVHWETSWKRQEPQEPALYEEAMGLARLNVLQKLVEKS